MGKERDFSVVFQRCLEAPCVREMTTRGSLARGQGKETFQGRVQVWIKKLSPVGGGQGSQRLTILKWVPTGEKSQAPDGPRYPQLIPVKSSEARTPISPQQRKATQAAPTLRLKLRQSQAQLSTPGSDEDPSRLNSAVETSGGAAADGGGAAAGSGQEAQSPRAPERPAVHAAPHAAGAAASALRTPDQAAAPAAPGTVVEDWGAGSSGLQVSPPAREPAAGQLAADRRATAAAVGAADAPRVVGLGLDEASGGAAEPADALASQNRAERAETGRSAGPSLARAGDGAAEPAGGSARVSGAAGAAGRGGGGSETQGSADDGVPTLAGAKRRREGAAQEPAAGDLRAAERGAVGGGEADAAKRARLGEGS